MGRVLKEEDYVGKKYGLLTVLRRTNKTKNGTYVWEFQCDCGNLYQQILTSVKRGDIKSCGCLKSIGLVKFNEQTRSIKIGDKFGKLTVLEEIGLRETSDPNHKRMWYKCQCDCGNITEKCGNQLKNGQVKSCGCLQSQGEYEIEQLLKKNDIQFIKEYVDNRLLKETGRRLRFDFAIFTDGKLSHFIEFNGRQHIEGFDTFIYAKSSPLELIQERDNIKKDFCEKYQIPLIIINYDKKGKIKIEDLLL